MSTPEFIAHLSPIAVFGCCTDYKICDVTWHQWGHDQDSISHHPSEGIILHVGKKLDSGFYWRWSLKLAEGIYVDHGADAVALEDACAAALSYQPTIKVFNWLDESTWYETQPGYLTAMLDGEKVTIRKSLSGKNYLWERPWKQAEQVFQAIGSFCQNCFQGQAETVETALVSVMEAPERFKMACAKMVADLRTPAQEAQK